jgi:hypothetical protein
MRRREPSTIGTLVFVLWGLIVWGLQFTALYFGHTWFCALGASPGTTTALAAIITAIAVAAMLPVAWAPTRPAALAGLDRRDDDPRHLILVARAVALLSIIAALWTGAAAIVVEACELAR